MSLRLVRLTASSGFALPRLGALVALAISARVAFAADGLLDPTFSSDGRQLVGFAHPPDNTDFAHAVVAQPDGALVLAGESYSGTETFASVARLLAGGLLDAGFAGDGRISFRFVEDGGQSRAEKVLARPDGAVIVVGDHWDGGDPQLALALLTADGDFDPAFGASLTPGRIAHSVPGGDLGGVTAAAVTTTGEILVGGYGTQTGKPDLDGFVARFTEEGELDGSFSGDGIAWIAVDLGGSDGNRVDAFDVQEDGKVVAVGAVARDGEDIDTAIVRLLASGSLDPLFDGSASGNGVVVYQLTDALGLALDAPESLLVQPDGKILFGGGALYPDPPEQRGYFARLLADGSIDPTLAAELLPEGIAMGSGDRLLGLQSDGKILFATTAAGSCTVLRYSASGNALDPAFGGDGIVTFTGASGVEITCLALELAGGRAVLAGYAAASDDEFFAARLQSDLVFADGFESGSVGEWGE